MLVDFKYRNKVFVRNGGHGSAARKPLSGCGSLRRGGSRTLIAIAVKSPVKPFQHDPRTASSQECRDL